MLTELPVGISRERKGQHEAILQDSDGKRERWFKHDDHAGYTVEIDGIGYEFASSHI